MIQPVTFRISIHALREEGDSRYPGVMRKFHYFYPRPPRGGRRSTVALQLSSRKFLSTPSARRATSLGDYFGLPTEVFLSTPSARRATKEGETSKKERNISIHALREEGDQPRRLLWTADRSISIHALREEGDKRGRDLKKRKEYFYPRPPRGGRPKAVAAVGVCGLFLSTPSARRATPAHNSRAGIRMISIHALREEGDFADSFQT